MGDPSPMELYARRVRLDAAVARRRHLARRLGGRLTEKYLETVPAVFTASGEFAAFRLATPSDEALGRLRDRAVLTLDSAAAVLAGFRFGSHRNTYAYFPSPDDLRRIVDLGAGERRPGTKFPLGWSPPGWEMLFAVIPQSLPPHTEAGGWRVVTPQHLIRELIGFYGLRTDLVAQIETKLAPLIRAAEPPPI